MPTKEEEVSFIETRWVVGTLCVLGIVKMPRGWSETLTCVRMLYSSFGSQRTMPAEVLLISLVTSLLLLGCQG